MIELKKVKRNNKRFVVEVDPNKGVNYEITFIGYRKDDSQTQVLKTVKGNSASYILMKTIYLWGQKLVQMKLKPIHMLKVKLHKLGLNQ